MSDSDRMEWRALDPRWVCSAAGDRRLADLVEIWIRWRDCSIM
jgi:hypothetical protein